MSQKSLVIPHIIDQHVEEAAFLWLLRHNAVYEPHYDLRDLAKLDERVAAHLDGITVAGEHGASVCKAALGSSGAGETFVAAVRAIEEKDQRQLDNLFALADTAPEALPGLFSAFGWVSAPYLQGTVATLLSSKESFRRQVGISACVMHSVDPGAVLTQSLANSPPQLRARAFRAVGELGRIDLLAMCGPALQDEDFACRFWAAWSAVLLGDRKDAVKVLERFVLSSNMFRQQALNLLLKVLDLQSAQQLLKTIAQKPSDQRLLIQGAGIAGDAQYLPWLIRQMEDAQFARVAGESFSMITGLDLAYLDLEQDQSENFEAGPTEKPEDENVDMDPDESLPWPDPIKLRQWLQDNQVHYQQGVRYFMGVAVSVAHCRKVLLEGYQHQRTAAAQYQCIYHPGMQLFPTCAPAWRQQRLLKKGNQLNG